ncbi:MAG: hypothetical protein FJX97_03330 [Bacteroidetes bacterium]|nr:hypothetical protein [Bacteroidota bacterium]
MGELIFYSVLLLAVLGHGWAAARWYKKIHQHPQLTFGQKNALKMRALIFPLGLWWSARKSRKN